MNLCQSLTNNRNQLFTLITELERIERNTFIELLLYPFSLEPFSPICWKTFHVHFFFVFFNESKVNNVRLNQFIDYIRFTLSALPLYGYNEFLLRHSRTALTSLLLGKEEDNKQKCGGFEA